MLWRKVEKDLQDWFEHSNTALLVSGARQVGKTYSIRAFLESTGCPYLEVNLLDQTDIIPLLEKSRKVRELESTLSAYYQKTLYPGKTIIFFDEVQAYKEIVTRIKFWVDEGSYRYILSGSLLGVELRALRSAPVGYLSEITMYPMDLEEFMRALNVPEIVFNTLRECFQNKEPVSEAIHMTTMQHFRNYLIVGGMPQAVQQFVRSGDLMRVSAIHHNIIAQHKMDFTQYEKEDKKLLLTQIFDQLPANLQKQNRRFVYNDLGKGLRFQQVESSFLWLIAAGVVIPTYNVTEPKAPLILSQKSSLVKLYCCDVGLLTTMLGEDAQIQLLGGKPKMNMGGLFENYVAQELHAHGFPLYFYCSHKNGELDFLIEQNLSSVPIEVKSGGDYTMHASLSRAVDNTAYDMQNAYVLADCNLKCDGKIQYLPIYLSMMIQKRVQLPTIDIKSLVWPEI